MRSLRGLSIQLFRSNRLLIATSIISIVISTMLVLTMLMYSIHAQHTMRQSFKDMFGEADMMVSYSPDQASILTKSKIDQIITLPEIEQYSEVSYESLKIGDRNLPVWTIGAISDELTRSTYKFESEVTQKSIVLNQELADFLDVVVGNEVSIEGLNLRVTEIIEDTVGAISIAIVHPSHLERFLREGEQAKGLMLKLVDGTHALAVIEKLRQVDVDLRIDLQEQNEVVVTNMQTLHTYIVVMSILVLVITSLLIVSNFEILLYKLRNQIAILRSLGSTTKQVRNIIMFQSMVINFCGVFIGTSLSILGMTYLFEVAERLFNLPSITAYTSYFPLFFIALTCFIVFQLFMLIPAYRSTKILPVKIAEENERLNFKHKNSRKSMVLTALGLALYIFGFKYDYYFLIFVGIFSFLIGVLLFFPYLIEKLIKVMLKLLGQKIGRNAYLAVKNMLPQVRRNSFSVISIAIIMIITIFGSTLLSTLDANNHRYLYENYETPIIVQNRLSQESSLDPNQLREELLQFESIRDVYYEGPKALNYLMINDEYIKIHPTAANSSLVMGLREDEIVISDHLATQSGLHVGDAVQVGYFDVESQHILTEGIYRIGKISEELNQSGYTLVTWSSPLNTFSTFDRMFIDTDNELQALADVEAIRIKYPELHVTSLSEALEQASEGFIQRWFIFIVVLIVIIGSAMVGILNGLINNILAKRKEFAVLRTLGVTPRGVVRMILSQISLYICLGIGFGCLVGLLLVLSVTVLDPTTITFDFLIVGLTALSILLLSIVTFKIIGRYVTRRSVTNELVMDGK